MSSPYFIEPAFAVSPIGPMNLGNAEIYSMSPVVPLVAKTMPTKQGADAVQLSIEIGNLQGAPDPMQLVIDGTFTEIGGWTGLGAGGWAHDAGNFEADHTVGTAGLLSQTIPDLRESLKYRTILRVRNWTADLVTLILGGTSGTPRGANGLFSEDLICATDGGDLDIDSPAAFGGSVDDISVQEIPSDMTVGLFAASLIGGEWKVAGLPLITALCTIESVVGGFQSSLPYYETLMANRNDFGEGVAVGVKPVRFSNLFAWNLYARRLIGN